MSHEITKQKRRWLKQILDASVAKAMWLAPIVLAPVMMTASVPSIALGQTPTAARSISDSGSAIDDQFVLDWLNYAAGKAGDVKASATAFTEALRAKQLIERQDKKLDARVAERLVQVANLLSSKGVKPEDIQGAIGKLGDMKAAPKLAATMPKPGQVVPAIGTPSVATATQPNSPAVAGPVTPGLFVPQLDTTQNQSASGAVQLAGPAAIEESASGEELYSRGLQQLGQGDREAAYESFRSAWRFEREMDPAIRNQLKDKLTSMQAASIGPGQNASQLGQVNSEQLASRQRWMSEVTGEIAAAEANREAEPQIVSERLQTLRTRVTQADLDGQTRKQMLSLVDRQITAHQNYMSQNKAAIDQNMRNRQVTEQMSLEQEQEFKDNQQIASLVDSYHDLMEEGRYSEAEVLAKQVGVINRDSEIASLLIANARNKRRILEYEDIRVRKEDGFIGAMNDVDASAVPWEDENTLLFPSAKTWDDITRRRLTELSEDKRGMSAIDAQIWERLDTPVQVEFNRRPLSEVAGVLQNMTGVPIVIDEVGIQVEGFASASEVPITLTLPSQIKLRSALELMLSGHNLTYDVRNEVLLITSDRNAGKSNVPRTYSVKNLVIPIPNFVHDYNSGMAGAIRQAYETVTAGRGLIAQAGGRNAGFTPGTGVQLASGSVDPNAPVLGQLNNALGGGNLPPQLGGFGLGGGNPPISGTGAPMSMGSPGAIGGGAAMADFTTLINLIQQTIEPDSWLVAGGTSTVIEYPSNLSIVVSAPQTTHEKIADLLESLRRLQDLQVTIEVKFITLNDTFFERMGVDFDMRIDDNVRALPQDDSGPSATVGLSANVDATNPFPVTGDFDVALSQNGFASAIPPFGGFDAESGASLGFAILSDLEMFFFMNAAQGDQRTNVLQAPRVTMFDGSFASINDTISRPFVTSLIPVVGDFAVAQQPVIVVLNEGTILNVQATVSNDKRFVRLVLNPSFSQIDNVETFTFEGSRTTRSGTNVLDPAGDVTGENDDVEEIITGTTVQQPSFAQTSISTVVSVPDGGTILLGGIKRMREGRVERGVPILSKIPYVNRLFKNTSIGRETSTLMMTVTPRIIIQEEEEQKYGVNP